MTTRADRYPRRILWLTPILLLWTQTVLGAALDRSVDAYVRDEMAKRHIPGLALAVIRRGRVERYASYGQASLEFAAPVTSTTLFHIASVTKTFTSVGVMKLVEAGKLKLDDSIGAYLEGLPDSWRGITIRQLLSHTSGLPDMVKSPTPDPIAETPEEALSLLRDRPLDFAPGTQYRYNQTNYMLLGLLIEKLSGLSYTGFCEKQLFAPAGLSNPQFGDSATLIKNRAPIYTPEKHDANGVPSDGLKVLNWKSPPIIHPNNGLNLSVEDFARWLVALMNDKVINKASLEALLTPTRLKDGSSLSEFPPSPHYPWKTEGLGWLLVPDRQHPAAGGTGGPYAAFIMYPNDSLAVGVLTNTQSSMPDSLVDDIARRYLAPSEGSN